jgi:glycosyltransferase involved in cell wall biosynthesis
VSTPSVSLIIPTLNEAHHLAELLPTLLAQTLTPLEIIVADAGSSDGTVAVAQRHGARVIPGGRPAVGRTNGARAAAGEWLCFVDADTRLPDAQIVERVVNYAQANGLTAVVCDCRPYYRPGDRGYDHRLLRLWDRLMLRAVSDGQRFWLRCGFPVGQAVFLVTRRDGFLAVGGFAEEAEPFEDSAYLLAVHRRCAPGAGRRSAVGVMPRECFVLVSTRRYDVRGRVGFPLSMAIRGALLRVGGEHADHNYWAVNQKGLYRERRTPSPPATDDRHHQR